jgi:hypothetical protein
MPKLVSFCLGAQVDATLQSSLNLQPALQKGMQTEGNGANWQKGTGSVLPRFVFVGNSLHDF